ncbi:class I SAM-dependent methyltransferase [Candidatus Methylobacter oryzae]|uniref:DUF1698 domain-containing protein n=1 Tax=Candidatus Methylobacter oryzae TaxID=2497749 RepID=A0ABY3C7W5_9GAMM|nr:DUF1698 domain-containing protein [Candidatus Methylobacter oryzae]TRW92202.1 DUF1698 domain-containing protein [Candidatus Methylobacter oryzae]
MKTSVLQYLRKKGIIEYIRDDAKDKLIKTNALQYLREKGVIGYITDEFTNTKGESLPNSWLNINNSDHMAAWKQRCHSNDLIRSELLTPAVVFPSIPEEFSFLQRPARLSSNEIEAELKSLAPWCYHVSDLTLPLGTYNEETILFHRFRNALICKAIECLLPIADTTFLDIGCNCGFFSLEMASRGAKQCLGIDLRDKNIAQANFLKSLYGINHVEFKATNVKSLGAEQFDVVFNLGLMYHLSTPLEVLQSCFNITKQVCVIDSICHTEPFSGYHVVTQKNIDSPIEGDLSFELQPTYRGLLDTIHAAGFTHIVELIGLASENIELYNDLSRRCFLAFKDPPNLAALKKIAE